MKGASVAFRGLHKAFESNRASTTAIEAIDLEIKAGEFLVLVGPSGCGKSTLLKLIAGLTGATSGRVDFEGEIVDRPRTDAVMIFQEHALFPWLDVLGNVEFGLRVKRIPREERLSSARAYLHLVGLEAFEHANMHELSGGMKQRVAIARALAMNPRVLLMDEPFAALDAQTRDGLLTRLQEIWLKERPTVVFVTHNVREAACLGDRVVVLAPRPTRIQKIFPVDAPRPRQIEDEAVIAQARLIKDALTEVTPSDPPSP